MRGLAEPQVRAQLERVLSPADDDELLGVRVPVLRKLARRYRGLRPEEVDALLRSRVIACYAAMEDALVASGVRRHASDSPADLLTRAADAGLAPSPAAPRLTTLFREARYSSHPMGPSHREAAAGALEEIASLLQDREAQR
ncbi:DUF4129 domain-containing protein [Streptomyces sp. NPDC058534]|uniref:DUF4129 domain-containing protein n=1 Tax=Streptomyces sp. NPDC058534 TaxID=3346541 RepID=UPI00364F5494